MTTTIARSAATRSIHLSFFFWLTVVMSGFIFTGFGMTYWIPMSQGTGEPLPPIVHLHGLTFSLWMILLMLQSLLVNIHRVSLHRSLGTFGIALATVMIISGISLPIMSAAATPSGPFDMDLNYLSFFAVFSFTCLFIMAIRQVRHSANHRRLILFATIPLLPPGINRFYMAGLGADSLPVLATYLTMDLFVAAILFYDWKTLGKLNNYTIVGTVFILTQQLLHFPVANSEAFASFVEILASLAYYR